MFHAFALGSRSQLALFCFPLRVFGTSNTMPLLGWIRVFTGRLSNLRPRIFLTVSWVNAFALGSRSQLALFCFPLRVFGTSNTMPLLGWIRVFTGRLSN